MDDANEWTLLCTVPTEVEAQIIQGVLNTHGIATRIEYESASRLFGITTGALGGARLYVPVTAYDAAHEVLDAQFDDDNHDRNDQTGLDDRDT